MNTSEMNSRTNNNRQTELIFKDKYLYEIHRIASELNDLGMTYIQAQLKKHHMTHSGTKSEAIAALLKQTYAARKVDQYYKIISTGRK